MNVAKSGLVKYYPKSFIFPFWKTENPSSKSEFVAGFDSQFWILTENKIAPTQDLEELYKLYKHERDDRIMLREESGQLSPELRLKVHLSMTHGTDSSGSILISVLLFHKIFFLWNLRKVLFFMRLRSKLSFSEFYDLGAWKFLILLLILQNHTLAFNFECHSINL